MGKDLPKGYLPKAMAPQVVIGEFTHMGFCGYFYTCADDLGNSLEQGWRSFRTPDVLDCTS